ncbi:MAG: ribonuclease R [Bdellovibrionales bacterium]
MKTQNRGHAAPAPKSRGKDFHGPKKHRRKDFPPRATKTPESPRRIVGVLSKSSQGWRIASVNRKQRGEYVLHAKQGRFELEQGHLAVAEEIKNAGRWGPREAKLLEVLGDMNAPQSVSLIAIATHEIPSDFSPEALKEAAAAQPVALGDREDLRNAPLVTIDGEDARDFDDAVFAEQTDNGWHLIVAIADVAHYVTPGSALDREAYTRGNSTYFPDRVVPMLPEALSNELCSLKPQVDRACMAAHLWLDKEGELTRWKFSRALMRSHARLTYTQVQQAIDGQPDAITKPLLDLALRPLYAAYACLIQARLKRGTLELDLPERKVEIGQDGLVAAIKIRDRYDSHKLIEEFMITANVAAAAQLEHKRGTCLYRVHDKPTELKLEGLRDFLDSLGISLVPKKQLHPRFLTQILENSAGGPHAQVINEVMLRSQAQAIYSPDNIGHFGLALARYAHFTSPIRRYADLVVHRGLIRALSLGPDGLTDKEIEKLNDIGEHISTTERRSSAAERDAIDRFITLFLQDRVGATFPARISGVARFGLFARLNETGADGIIPLESLPDDHYWHDEKRQSLTGRRTRQTFRLAQPVLVRLEQADRLTGSMAFSIVADTGTKKPAKPNPTSKPRNKNKAAKPHRQA